MRALLLVAFLAFGAFFVACSDDDDSPAGPAAPLETPGEEATPGPDGLQYVFDTVGSSFDMEELRTHLAPELQSMTDEELAEAVMCFPSDVTADVIDQQITRNGPQATLVRIWQVTSDGASTVDTTVERTWTFERVSDDEDSGYLITGLPEECPFESADPAQDRQEPQIETPDPD